MLLNGKTVKLTQLQDELTSAGVPQIGRAHV